MYQWPVYLTSDLTCFCTNAHVGKGVLRCQSCPCYRLLTLPCAAGTSDREINDIFGNAGSRGSQGSKPSESQTFEGVITSSKQTGAQSGGQGDAHNGGQTGHTGDKESKAQGGKQGGGQIGGMTSAPTPARTAKAASGDFTGTNQGNSPPLNNVFSPPLNMQQQKY